MQDRSDRPARRMARTIRSAALALVPLALLAAGHAWANSAAATSTATSPATSSAPSAAPASPGCSRVIRVPLAPVGLSVITSGGAVGGVYPDLLRKVGADAGCRFDFSVVPRARLEAMYFNGSADVMMPATRTTQRDGRGDFVALLHARPMLISLSSDRAPMLSLDDLRERRELRVALVRGFDYGPAYQRLLKDLRDQKRLVLEADALAVARALERSLVDVTLMAPSVFTGALLQDGKGKVMVERLRYEAVSELGWGDSGVYLSNDLPAADRKLLAEALERGVRSGLVWKTIQRYYPPGSYEDSLRPR